MIDRRKLKRRTNEDRRALDRRAEPRVSSQFEIRLLRSGHRRNEVLDGVLLDVSPAGLQLRVRECLELADRLLVEVRDAARTCFNLSTKVVWIERIGLETRAGCELLVDLPQRRYNLLRRLIVVPAN